MYILIVIVMAVLIAVIIWNSLGIKPRTVNGTDDGSDIASDAAEPENGADVEPDGNVDTDEPETEPQSQEGEKTDVL